MHHEWESPSSGVHRCRLPFLDVTVGVILGRDGAVVVDTGSTLEEAASVAADVAELGGVPVRHVVLTHDHFDHVLGAPVFAGAELWAAPRVAETLARRRAELRADAIRYGADAAAVDRALAAISVPEHRIRRCRIDLGARTVDVEHLGRGHTDHDLVVRVGAGASGDPVVVFCGDLVEESADPAVGPDADPRAWVGTLDRLLDFGGEHARYVPGHGATVDAAFVRRQQDQLRRM